jgi:hypothetical protein
VYLSIWHLLWKGSLQNLCSWWDMGPWRSYPLSNLSVLSHHLPVMGDSKREQRSLWQESMRSQTFSQSSRLLGSSTIAFGRTELMGVKVSCPLASVHGRPDAWRREFKHPMMIYA